MSTCRIRAGRGFTLLEVLIALVVLALALAAAVGTASSMVREASYLEERTVADWVARNKLVELQSAHTWPDVGQSSGSAQMMGREWDWTLNVSGTPVPDIRRADVEVRLKGHEGTAISTLTGYLRHAP